MTERPLLEIEGLNVSLRGRGLRRGMHHILKSIDLDIRAGETVGLVGESGSGKSTLGRAVLGLVPTSAGRITFAGEDITHLGKAGRRRLASDIQVIFQDPYSSLSPSLTVGDTLAEPLRATGLSRHDAIQRIGTLLDLVQLPRDAAGRYPREFSGGQRQRVAIARALAREPRFVVCDEPVSALDLTTQAQILKLMIELQERTGVAYLFISHDLDVVRVMSHRIAVMYQGEIIERGDCAQITTSPQHPYTERLLFASPIPDPAAQAARRAKFEATERAHQEFSL